jgi:EAL domain-containing protein (putative c-di-GMP-specific phosphodiesterase class I)
MMYAKRMGGDRIEAYRANSSELGVSQSTLNADLERAIDQRELQMHFQPIYDLANDRLSGAEALMRWNHPNRGAISPEEFIPLAERTGLIDRLGQVVIEQTAIQLKSWIDNVDVPDDFFVSLNLSAQQLAKETLLNEMRTLIASHGDLVERVLLEVTESQVMASPEHSAYVLEALKGMGFRLALDDFGVGHSSLSYLHRFPFDFVKIPSTFVQTEERHGIAQTQVPIMKAIVTLAKDLDLKVIAEGAENDEEVERLKTLQVRYAQGFAFSKPLTGPQMLQLLKKQKFSQNKSLPAAD